MRSAPAASATTRPSRSPSTLPPPTRAPSMPRRSGSPPRCRPAGASGASRSRRRPRPGRRGRASGGSPSGWRSTAGAPTAFTRRAISPRCGRWPPTRAAIPTGRWRRSPICAPGWRSVPPTISAAPPTARRPSCWAARGSAAAMPTPSASCATCWTFPASRSPAQARITPGTACISRAPGTSWTPPGSPGAGLRPGDAAARRRPRRSTPPCGRTR